VIWLGALSLAIWLGLCATGFWRCSEREDALPLADPRRWPDVVAVIPARNEADVIARSLGSVVAQDYPGSFRVVLVDDNSEDGTAEIAGNLNSPSPSAEGLGWGLSSTHDVVSGGETPPPAPPLKGRGARVTVLPGKPLATGWTGKLWALSQGIAAAGTPTYLWLTDADIEHAPSTLRRLVAIAEGKQRKLVSFMAMLHCQTLPERAIIPAFVYYFSMLYPFNWINRPSPISGAAGGCVLVEREALETAGGIAAIRTALIDDCALGALLKQQGPIWLGLTHRSRSIRPYLTFGDVGAMIARSAYAQLRYSPLILAATVSGLLTMFAVPVWLTVAGQGTARTIGFASVLLMILMYQPILRYYRLSPLWALAQPLVGGFYTLCVLSSGWQHWRGRGGMWKGRAQAPKQSNSVSAL
jgi:hopene-associated glycosyltransferase HpnB